MQSATAAWSHLRRSVLRINLLLLNADLLGKDVGGRHLILYFHGLDLGLLHQYIHIRLHPADRDGGMQLSISACIQSYTEAHHATGMATDSEYLDS